MFNLRRFFFPYDKFSREVLNTIAESPRSRLFFGDLWKTLTVKANGKEVCVSKLSNCLTKMKTEGLLTRTRWVMDNGPRFEYGITYRGVEALNQGLSFAATRSP